MTEKHNEKNRMKENSPDKIRLVEDGIDIEIQKDYISESHNYVSLGLSAEEIENLGRVLLSTKLSIEDKKKALGILAHVGTAAAYRILSNYAEKPELELKEWAIMAQQECGIFLACEFSDESEVVVFSGAGAKINKMRCYFLVLPSGDKTFSPLQHKIIEHEMTYISRYLNCVIEDFEFLDRYVSLNVLFEMDVAIATFMEGGIKNCNVFGNFVLEDYYATNIGIPDKEEIEVIIKIVRAG